MVDVYVNLRFFPDARALPEAVARWEELGVAGVTLGDHIFSPAAPYRTPQANRGMDQLTILTVIATLSKRLRVGTVASNVGFQHPLLLIRKFAQLAVLYGGNRVYAGFGAGWAKREFEAMGLRMPRHAERLDRLEDSLRLARQLFDDGFADTGGEHVAAHELPLAPRPETPPLLLVGGGSQRLLGLAGRYCDHIDLNAPSHRQSGIEPQRRMRTTVEDLEASVETLRDAETAAGRTPGSVTTSVTITELAFCREAEIDSTTERICASFEMPTESLLESPYALLGEPQRMADTIREREERLGLAWVGIPFSDVERFYADVVPLLG